MYHPAGEYVTDFCIVRRGQTFHLFHIRGERWTWPLGYREIDLGHAVSADLCAWTAQPPVLGPGAPGAWDETGIWAPDIIEVDGTYYLFYTGSDAQNNQAIGLATSADLVDWVKHPGNPLVVPGAWSDRAVGRDVAGRDGMVYADAERGRYLIYYTATLADGRACIALAESRDLLSWTDLGPTYVEQDRSYNRCESPYLVRHGDSYYLFYSAKGGPKSKGFPPGDFAHFDIEYLVAATPSGPWRPANHTLLERWTCASEHPTFDGVTYMLYIVQEQLGDVWGASFLSDPKRIEWLADGTLAIRERLPHGVARRDLIGGGTRGLAAWISHGGAWRIGDDGVLQPPSVDGGAFLTDTLIGADLAFEAEIWLGETGEGSLLVRANPSALAGYRVALDVASGRLGLYLRYPGAADRPLQERKIAIERAGWRRLRVVAHGVCLEVYVDETLWIVHSDRTYTTGCLGLQARGEVRFRNLRADTDAPPGADWVDRCLPRHLVQGTGSD
ncbi:MAG TPA: family 43 glycosylhydrolase [Roseiflexaceae bacterium]|nr:family 43 glycosylhydrolase [Roseiflexaceae bacterium]